MFSRNLLLKDNDLSENRKGATGAGILLKDVDDIFVEGNTIIRNRYGLTAEGSPQEIGASATFVRNLFALNDTGVGLFSSAPITFVENSMIENIVQVEAQGGQLGSSVLTEAHNVDQIAGVEDAGSALPPGSRTAIWTTDGRGNYWSDYNGYDADDDGIGDQPYQPKPAFASALEENPTLRLFQFTLANEAIEMASDMLPVYRYSPVMEDGSPLMSPVGPALPAEEGVNGDLLLVSVLLLGLSAAVMQVALDFDPLGAAWRSGKRFAGAFRGETP
jgi:nitrous oxidase accessory protein